MSKQSEADALKLRGNQEFERQNYPAAIQLYTSAISLDPSNATIFSNRSGAYTANMQYVEAECDAYATIRLDSKWVKGYTRLVNSLIGEKRYEDAIFAFRKAKVIEPNNDQIDDYINSAMNELKYSKNPLIYFGVPLLFELMKHNKYQSLIENPVILKQLRALQYDPSSTPEFAQDPVIADIIQFSFKIMHNLEFFNTEPPKSTDKFQSFRPNNSMIIDETKKNKILKNKAKQTHPEAGLVYKDEGNNHFHNKEYGNAILSYTKAINCDPNNSIFYGNRAAVFATLDLPYPAISDSDKAIQIKPNYFRAYNRKARCYFDLKEYIKAYECYEEVLALDPDNQEAIKGMSNVIDKICEICKFLHFSSQLWEYEPEAKNAINVLTQMKFFPLINDGHLSKNDIVSFFKMPNFRESFGILLDYFLLFNHRNNISNNNDA